jgi:cytochrome c oxidase accessory protein FixG
MACVNVCPMGIDIRDGQQMECITCALCIDACDEIMDKVGKPRGLIDYIALTDEANERAGNAKVPVLRHILRPRTMVYTALWSAIGIGLVVALFIRSEIDMTVAQIRHPQFVTLSDGSVRNTYDIRIRNMTAADAVFRVGLTSDDVMRVELEGGQDRMVEVPADETLLQRVYVIARPEDVAAARERTDFRFWVEQFGTEERAFQDTTFFGRGQQ